MQQLLQRSTVKVLKPLGHINASNALVFQHDLQESVMSAEYSAVLVDMSAVESLDSAGLMALVSALNAAQQSSKQFALGQIPPAIRIIFEMTQLDRAFQIVDDAKAFEDHLLQF
ncbi:MAG: STAS domain-containing protein [Kaiparowitsia implicata GSE-PSE-MK54-09C]|jgi:anti-anti-sigma factor|nr:STAS domain-containing protein [Kaiparowitsia implicata GSE-PSE-MK54-09C]